MPLAWFATLAAVVFASVGACGLFASAFFKDIGRRRSVFRVATFGFTLAGLVLMLAGVAGILGAKELYGGLLMAVFGTGSTVLQGRTARPAKPDELTH